MRVVAASINRPVTVFITAVAAVVFGGDGSTSEGDFHEGLNAAGVFKANTVFVIQNNQWAISTFQGTAGGQRRAFAARGLGLGIPGIRVDGNDLLAFSYDATRAENVRYPGAGMDAPKDDSDTYRLSYERCRLGSRISP